MCVGLWVEVTRAMPLLCILATVVSRAKEFGRELTNIYVFPTLVFVHLLSNAIHLSYLVVIVINADYHYPHDGFPKHDLSLY